MRPLKELSARPPSSYESISLAELMTYIVEWLERTEQPRSIEAITVAAWRLFPKKFSMVGFPEFPDAFRVNRSLLQGQPKYRNLLVGTPTKGYTLTHNGAAVAAQLARRFGEPTDDLHAEADGGLDHRVAHDRQRTIDAGKALDDMRESQLYRLWSDGKMAGAPAVFVYALLGVYDHTPGRIRSKIFRELVRAVEMEADSEMQAFLRDVQSQYPAVFEDSIRRGVKR